MSLPVPAPVFTAERCFLPQPAGLRRSPSTIRNGAGLHSIPQECPGGTADNLEACSCTWTRSNTRVLWKWLESSRNIWCVRFKLGYTQMDTRVVQFGSMSVQNWSLWESKAVWDGLVNQAGLCQSPLRFQGLRCVSTMSWVVSSSAHCCKTQHAQQELNAPVLAPISAPPDHILSPIHVFNAHWAVILEIRIWPSFLKKKKKKHKIPVLSSCQAWSVTRLTLPGLSGPPPVCCHGDRRWVTFKPTLPQGSLMQLVFHTTVCYQSCLSNVFALVRKTIMMLSVDSHATINCL